MGEFYDIRFVVVVTAQTAEQEDGSRIRIRDLATLPDRAAALHQAEQILLVSAAPGSAAFGPDPGDFLARWLDPYVEAGSRTLLLACQGGDRVVGLLTGSFESGAATEFARLHPYTRFFEDLYPAYPAHLHVNCHPEHRCRGIGTALVRAYLRICRSAGLPGLHLITAPTARNVAFYRRNGFSLAEERKIAGRRYLFLGQEIDLSDSATPESGAA